MRILPALLTAAILASSAAHAASIGTAASVTKLVNGKISGADRVINLGDEVVANEQVRTGPDSATRLNFLDNTSVTIGAGSSVTLDKFVYNPDKSAQSTVIKMAKGSMRFVTGQSSPENFTLQTSTATIGIRGTDVTIVCDANQKCSIAVTDGNVLVCPKVEDRLNGRSIPALCPNLVSLDRTSNFTTVSPGGKTSGPQSVPASTVASLNNSVAAGQPGINTTSLSSQATAAPAAPVAPAGTSATNDTKPADSKTADPANNDAGAKPADSNNFTVIPVTSGGPGGGAVSP